MSYVPTLELVRATLNLSSAPDIAFGDTGVRRGIVSALSSEFPGVYTNENIALVGTHSHSGVGGYFEVCDVLGCCCFGC